MQKFVMKLIKKYKINTKTYKNIKIKECFCNNAYYTKIIDDSLPFDPLEKEVLKSVNYCGINKINERIFIIKKIPKFINKNTIKKFTFEFLPSKSNDDFNKNNFFDKYEFIKKKMDCDLSENSDVLKNIILTNEKFTKDFLFFNNYFSNEIINDPICKYFNINFDNFAFKKRNLNQFYLPGSI
jgi:hypothetical protein